MTDAELLIGGEHEQVVFCRDEASGLRAIIAIHSTALGPALGGTRFFPYAAPTLALADVLRLSRAMSYKNALAGLPHGGGKAVIIGDPRTAKTAELLAAYGRFVETLNGRYVTAADVGTTVADLDLVGRQTRWATGRSREGGGSGDSSLLTALGVFEGMRAGALHVWGEPTLRGRTVGISGVGKVGSRLADHLIADGADVLVADVNAAAVAALIARRPSIRVAADTDALVRERLDVYAPCAMGGALDDETVAALTARLVCGAANNQLADESPAGTGAALQARGIVYAPDFLVNAGGVIQVSDELLGFDLERATATTKGIYGHTVEVLDAAATAGVTPVTAAERLAEERMASGGVRPWLLGHADRRCAARE